MLPLLSLLLLPLTTAQPLAATAANLAGTWTSKSHTVLTGRTFYDPSSDRLLEPRLPGLSLSFTEDGFFEAAYYRIAANPTKPDCTTAVLQWQHGTYVLSSNSPQLVLNPIPFDGRQVLSSPCTSKTSIYTRWNQTESYAKLALAVDAYRADGTVALRIERMDGIQVQPLYRVSKSPEENMLPRERLDVGVKAEEGKVRRRGVGRVLEEREEREEIGRRLKMVGVACVGIGSLGVISSWVF